MTIQIHNTTEIPYSYCMNIKDYRLNEKLSQSEFAKKYSIQLRTLQDWEQGRSNPPRYLISFLENTNNPFGTLPEIGERNPYKVCIAHPFLNADKIYPIQQNRVREVIDACSNNESVARIIVFGSSVSDRCREDSDLDIYVEMKENSKPFNKIFDFELDLWTNYMVDKQLLKEIDETGVVVYEQNLSR